MYHKILDHQELYYLKKLREHIPESVIAGGAVRDLVFNKPYKDVDIFVHVKNNELYSKYGLAYLIDEVFADVFECYDFSNMRGNWFNDTSSRTDRVLSVVSVEKDNTDYQLCLVDLVKAHSLKRHFDFNCNLVYHDGETIHKSDEFKQFVETKVLTPLKNTRGEWIISPSNLYSRVEHLLSRYQDCTLEENLKKFVDNQKKKRESLGKRLVNTATFPPNYDVDWYDN